jgi:anti-anti-sigma regulatory factor
VPLRCEPEYRRGGPHGYRGVAPSCSAKEFGGSCARLRPLLRGRVWRKVGIFRARDGYRCCRRVDSLAQVARFAGRHVTGEGHPGQRRLTIQFQRLSDNTTIVGLVGELWAQGAMELREALADELIGSPELLVINLSNIVEINSDGVDALHSVAEIAAEGDIQFCLVATPDGRVRRRLDALQRTEFFAIFPSVIEALRRFR